MISYTIARLIHDCFAYDEAGAFDEAQAVKLLQKVLGRVSARTITKASDGNGITAIFVTRITSDIEECGIIFEGTGMAMRPLIKLVVLHLLSSPHHAHVSDIKKRATVAEFLEPEMDDSTFKLLVSSRRSDREFMGAITRKIEDASRTFKDILADLNEASEDVCA